METLYPIMYMAATVVIVVASVILVVMLVNSTSNVKAKLLGMWINEPQTIRILIHQIDSEFQGKIVWVNSNEKTQMLGHTLLKDLVIKSFVQGSSGIYIDPISKEEFAFRLWFRGKGIIKMTLNNKVNGRDELLREEKWFRL